MAVSRAPGDVTPKSEQRLFHHRRWMPDDSGDISHSASWYENYRPWYPSGRKSVLRGGQTFRHATDYAHVEYKLGSYEPYFVEGEFNSLWGPRKGRLLDEYECYYLLRHGFSPLAEAIPLEMRNEAVTKALNKIADQKVNLGEALATAGQTARMFAGNAKSVADALIRIRQDKQMRPLLWRSYRQLRRDGVPEYIADKYLEYIYGLAPLLNDVYTGLKLTKTGLGKSLLLSGEGKSQRTFIGKPHNRRTMLSYSTFALEQATCNSRAKCKIWAQIDPNWGGIRAVNQLGLLNPLGLLWDLVPYSFVVDWLLPVGPVLYALTAPAGLEFVDGSLSAKHMQQSLYDYKPRLADDFYLKEKETLCKVPHTYNGYWRAALSSWPRPGLWIDRDPLRGDRIFKAAALAISSLMGAKPPIR